MEWTGRKVDGLSWIRAVQPDPLDHGEDGTATEAAERARAKVSADDPWSKTRGVFSKYGVDRTES